MDLRRSLKLWKGWASRQDGCAPCDPSSDECGRTIARWLSAGERAVSLDVAERLRAARFRAIASRKVALQQVPPVIAWPNFIVSLGGSQHWFRIGATAPLVVLVVGLVLIMGELDDRAMQLEAEVDVQLLTDVLPPTAYLDAGFREFLRPALRRTEIHQDSLRPTMPRRAAQ